MMNCTLLRALPAQVFAAVVFRPPPDPGASVTLRPTVISCAMSSSNT